MPDDTWTPEQAKARFDELLARASQGLPQRVTLSDGRVVLVQGSPDDSAPTPGEFTDERNRAFTALLLAIPPAPTTEPDDDDPFPRAMIRLRDFET